MDTSYHEIAVIADLFRSDTLLEYRIAEQVLARLDAERTWISRGGEGEVGLVLQCT